MLLPFHVMLDLQLKQWHQLIINVSILDDALTEKASNHIIKCKPCPILNMHCYFFY